MRNMRKRRAGLVHKHHDCHVEAPYCIQRCQSAMLRRTFLDLFGVLPGQGFVDLMVGSLIVVNIVLFPANAQKVWAGARDE